MPNQQDATVKKTTFRSNEGTLLTLDNFLHTIRVIYLVFPREFRSRRFDISKLFFICQLWFSCDRFSLDVEISERDHSVRNFLVKREPTYFLIISRRKSWSIKTRIKFVLMNSENTEWLAKCKGELYSPEFRMHKIVLREKSQKKLVEKSIWNFEIDFSLN